MSGPFTPGQVLTAAQLNAAIPTSIATATSPDAGALTGAEEITASRGTGVLQTALTTIAQWVIQTYQGFTQSGTGAVARTAQDKLRERVSVKDFGAKGDGTTDDSTAITVADAACKVAGRMLWFPDGVYCANNLSMTAGWDMPPVSTILYNGSSTGDNCVTVAASNVKFGRVNIDGNNQNFNVAFWVNSPGAIGDEVTVSNLLCPPTGVVNSAVKFSALTGFIKRVAGYTLVNTGNSNVSCPQLLTFGGGSNNCVVEQVTGRTLRAGIVAFSAGSINYVGHAEFHDIYDNGCYMPLGTISVKTLRYDGYDEPLVSIGGGGTFGTVICTQGGGANAVLGVNNSDFITIGEIIVMGANACSYILRSRGNSTQLCNPIKIGRISGEFYGAAPFFLNDTVNIPAGSLAALSIGGVHLTHYFNANSFSGSWCRLDAAQQLDLGHMTIKVVDTLNNTGSGNTGDLHLVINPALTYPSIADTLAVTIYNSDGVTPSARNFFGDNFFQQNMTYVGTANVHNSLASILKWDGTLSNGGGLFSSAIPTAGFWKIGQTVWQLNPTSAGTPGWRCTASGTPATWRLMVPLLNGSGGFSVSGGINSTPVGTTTPSSGAFTTLSSTGPITLAKPGTVTGPTYSQAVTDSSLIFNGTATQAVTLISPASCSGQILYVKNVTAFALASASANVVPLGSMTAGTAILAATAGKFAMLQSDGTNWVTMMAN